MTINSAEHVHIVYNNIISIHMKLKLIIKFQL